MAVTSLCTALIYREAATGIKLDGQDKKVGEADFLPGRNISKSTFHKIRHAVIISVRTAELISRCRLCSDKTNINLIAP